MEPCQDDLIRIKELMQRTGEFIAYFELAETKMLEWREEIERQASFWEQNTQKLYTELQSMHHLLAQAGTANFRVHIEKALTAGEANLHQIESCCKSFNENVKQHHDSICDLVDKSIDKIDKKTSDTLNQLTHQLSKYDVQHFHRIATESCDHVERVATSSVVKSSKLLHSFQFRFNFLAIITTTLTAFIIVLYLSDEFPWEIHRQAKNERQAGKVLLQAWPNLTQVEKERILSYEASRNG